MHSFRLLAAAVVASALFRSEHAPAQTRIWIDTDPSIGSPYREVDDAFALVVAFHSPERRIAGISTTYGNAGLKRTTTVARDLVRRFGAPAGVTEACVYAGSAGNDTLGRSTAATQALAAVLKEERLTYVALGPLTNLATLLQVHPELASRLDGVIFVGGRTPGRALAFGTNGWLQIHDANVFKDPTAARVVFESKVPLLLAPTEVGAQLVLTRDDARKLSSDGAAGRFLQRGSRIWLWFWTAIVRHPGGPMFDSLAVIAAVKPELVGLEKRYAAVLPDGDLIAARKPFRNSREVSFCTRAEATAKTIIINALKRDVAAQSSR
ncbi:MAG: nucleoside hydrolase [Chthoniobacterales bacterium]|nr:nucleoside hydrolase [Chthoniobacterales bacterium]